DPIRHLLRRHSVVIPNDADDRNINVRKDVDWSAKNDERRKQHDDQGHHDERVWPAQRQLDYPHGRSPSQIKESTHPGSHPSEQLRIRFDTIRIGFKFMLQSGKNDCPPTKASAERASP